MLRRLAVYLSLTCTVTVLYSCSGSSYREDTVYLFNPSSTPITIYIDQEPVILKDSLQSKSLSVGKHALTFDDYRDTLNVTGETNILINPTRAKLIKEEIVFRTEYLKDNRSGGDPDYITPFTSFTLDSLRYGGHILITDAVIVNKWFFNIWQPVAETVDAKKYMNKGLQSGGTNPLDLSSFKLNTLKEFTRKTLPLNYTKSYIEYVVQHHLDALTDVNLIRYNGRYFMAGENMDNLATMAKMHVSNDGKLWLEEPYLYRKEDHGKVLGTLYHLDSCMIKYEDGKIVGPAQVSLVKTEESLPLRVVIK
jgi:hypothetical protein